MMNVLGYGQLDHGLMQVLLKQHTTYLHKHQSSHLAVFLHHNNYNTCFTHPHVSRDMRFCTMWYMPPAQAQTSLHVRAVWSEPLQAA